MIEYKEIEQVFTSRYIKMCTAATEIQQMAGKYCFLFQDIYWLTISGMVIGGRYYRGDDFPDYIDTINGYEHTKDLNPIWLPRQDQLQEMTRMGSGSVLQGRFCEWLAEYYNDTYKIDISSNMEIWLCFLMRGRFSKIWNGTKWEKKI